MAKRSAKSAPPKLDASTLICVLQGPEALLRRDYLHQLRDHLTEAHGEVEVFEFDGNTVELAAVLDELRSFSLMQTYKMVVVNHAESFVSSHREALERYAKSPVDHATLVLRSEKWNRGNLDKAIAKVGEIVRCEAPSGAGLRKWITDRAPRKHDRKITAEAADALADRFAGDLGRLDSELGKLAVMVGPDEAIDVPLIEQVVGRSSDEQAWAAQDAVLKALTGGPRDREAVIVKLHEIVDVSGQPDVLVSYFVADLFRKLETARLMKKQGIPDAQITKEMKLWGERRSLFFKALARFRGDLTGRKLDQILEADRRSKSGFGETMRNLETFCAALADNP